MRTSAAPTILDGNETSRRHSLDLNRLETFCVVATTRNFTRAAVELGYSQSSVTTRIKALEREFGVELFERCRFSKNVVLTEAGCLALEYASRLLALAKETQQAVRDCKIENPLGPFPL